MKKPLIFTIGHSTRPIEEFISILRTHGVKELVDVRTVPMSRHNPQFNTDALKQSLLKSRIRYRHIKKLGGLRHAKKNSMTNLGWRNGSFRGYADYMATPDFSKGLAMLTHDTRIHPAAIMCAEAVPWRCHRSLVADALIKQGWNVQDIMSLTSAKKHRLTPFLKMKNGQITYPAVLEKK